MKLKLRPKASKSTTSTTVQKSAKQKKKENDNYRSKTYNSITEYKYTDVDSTINALQYNQIINCDVTKVNIAGDIIELKNSWVELLLLMLDTIRVNCKGDFLNLLMSSEITDQDFCVDKNFGKYNFDKDKYRAYKLYDSEYFVESTFTFEVVYREIINMAKILGIKPDMMSFHLVNKNVTLEDIRMDELEEKSIAVNINEALPYFKDNIFLMDMSIINTSQAAKDITHNIRNTTKAHNIQSVLMIFINYVYDNYAEKDVTKLVKIEGDTYLRTKACLDSKTSMQVRNSKFFIYSDLNNKGVLEFIDKSMKVLKINEDDIKLYFRKRKEPGTTKEYEVD